MPKIDVCEYHMLVANLFKRGEAIMPELTSSNMRMHVISHALLETIKAGTQLDEAKRILAYNKEPSGMLLPHQRDEVREFIEQLTPHKVSLLHAAMGIATEAIEILDSTMQYALGIVEEHDIDNAKEELGDIEFYSEAYRQEIDIMRNSVLEANIAKLNDRYHQGTFSNEQAMERADKQDEDQLDLPLEKENG